MRSGLIGHFILLHGSVGWLGGPSRGLVWVCAGDSSTRRWAKLGSEPPSSRGPAFLPSPWRGGFRILRGRRQELSLSGLDSAVYIMSLPSHSLGQSQVARPAWIRGVRTRPPPLDGRSTKISWACFLLLFAFFRATYGRSQARGQIGYATATAARDLSWSVTYTTAHGNPDTRPTEQGQGSNLHPHGYLSVNGDFSCHVFHLLPRGSQALSHPNLTVSCPVTRVRCCPASGD